MNYSTESAIAMTLVPDEQRLDFWLNHFGAVKGWATVEVVIFTAMGQSATSIMAVTGSTARSIMVVPLSIPISTQTP